MFQRILKCDYEFVTPWWDEVSENAKVGASSVVTGGLDTKTFHCKVILL